MCPPSAGAFDACITAPNPLRPRASPRALPAGFYGRRLTLSRSLLEGIRILRPLAGMRAEPLDQGRSFSNKDDNDILRNCVHGRRAATNTTN